MNEKNGLMNKKMTERIENLKLEEIIRNPYQPRIEFDEEKLNELAISIKENGVLQPIIVRKSKVIGYELLAGERRFLASQRAGITEIPSIIRDYNDQEMMTLSILENLQRENLNPIEEARSLKNLQEKAGLTHEEISKILGKSRSYVTNLIRVLSLPKELLYLVEQGELSVAHARTLLGLSDEIKQLDLARLTLKKKLSVRELEKLVYNVVNDKSSKKVSSNKSIYVEEMEQHLKKILGNSVKITSDKRNKGKIELKFNNLDEMEKIIQKLKN